MHLNRLDIDQYRSKNEIKNYFFNKKIIMLISNNP